METVGNLLLQTEPRDIVLSPVHHPVSYELVFSLVLFHLCDVLWTLTSFFSPWSNHGSFWPCRIYVVLRQRANGATRT